MRSVSHPASATTAVNGEAHPSVERRPMHPVKNDSTAPAFRPRGAVAAGAALLGLLLAGAGGGLVAGQQKNKPAGKSSNPALDRVKASVALVEGKQGNG